LYQSTRHAAYHQAVTELATAGLAYRCRCPRGERNGPGSCGCRNLQLGTSDTAWRLQLPPGRIVFQDGIQGHCEYDSTVLGDPVIFRRDGVAAYQLAVALDDAFQGITHVVRGAD